MASASLKLRKCLLCISVSDAAWLDQEDRSITASADYRSIDYSSDRRCVNQYVIVIFPDFFQKNPENVLAEKS